jgi:thioredoxin 1
MVEVLKFGASWCGPCRVMEPTIKKLEEKYNVEGSDIKITDIDVDSDKREAVKYGVRSVPTIIFLKDDDVKERLVGVRTENEIEGVLESLKN